MTHDDPRLSRLLGFLERDPDNRRLLLDAAEAAYAAARFDQAAALVSRMGPLESLSAEAANLAGLVALGRARHEEAVQIFSSLLRRSRDAGTRFNLAWAHAMLGDYRAADRLLDDEVLRAVPRAPALKVRMLHHLERYDQALDLGERLVEADVPAPGLLGALATLALDAERPDLARRYAERSPPDAQALAALGTLALADDDVPGAATLFEAAIARDASNPRAWIGKGLALAAANKPAEAAPALDRGATLFEDHIGSWLASGWSRFASGDIPGACERFERALAIDPTFAETHGALAVIDVTSGREEEGRRKAAVALRLDRNAFGGQLAQLLLLELAGDRSGADRVRARALSATVGAGGQTIGRALAALARRRV